MKLKNATFFVAIFAAFCCALPAHAKAPSKAKPKKKPTTTSGTGTISTSRDVQNLDGAVFQTGNANQLALYYGDVSGAVSQTAPLWSGATVLSGATQLSGATLSVSNPPALPPGAYYAFNSDGIYSNADLQALINYLKTGHGSTSTVSTTGDADLQAFLPELKSGLGSTSTVTSSDINGDGLFMYNSNNTGLLSVDSLSAQPNFIPEPTSAILAGCGLVMLLAARRRLKA